MRALRGWDGSEDREMLKPSCLSTHPVFTLSSKAGVPMAKGQNSGKCIDADVIFSSIYCFI